jgi:hypothetical protein
VTTYFQDFTTTNPKTKTNYTDKMHTKLELEKLIEVHVFCNHAFPLMAE